MRLRQGGPVAAPPARLLAQCRPPCEPPRRPVCPRPRPARANPASASPRPVPLRRARFADRAPPPVCRFLRRFAPDPSKPSAIRGGFESLSAHCAQQPGSLTAGGLFRFVGVERPGCAGPRRLRRRGFLDPGPAARDGEPSPPTVKNRTWLCLLASRGTTTLRLGVTSNRNEAVRADAVGCCDAFCAALGAMCVAFCVALRATRFVSPALRRRQMNREDGALHFRSCCRNEEWTSRHEWLHSRDDSNEDFFLRLPR